MVALVVAGAVIARRASVDRPGKAQSAVEVVVEFLQNLVFGTAGPRLAKRIFPLIGALFFFIIISNYSGLLPGVGTIQCESLCGYDEEAEEDEEARLAAGSSIAYAAQPEEEAEEEHESPPPLFRSPSADLNMTLAMSLITFTLVQVAGISAHGVAGRIKHMADPWWIFPIELISELGRIISLSFRLFGNIFAGEVLVTVMVAMANAIRIAIIPIALPVIFLYLEVLFGFIQALVFALLTLIYISLAAAGGHDDHEEEHGHEATPHAVPSAAGD
jgi:F-type H+-transporting ATPase subunit a